MAQPAPQKDVDITPSVTIEVTYNSTTGKYVPSVDPAQIELGGSILFINETSQPLSIELYTHENNHHPAVSVYLPINTAPGGIYLVNDPQHSDSFCYYNLVPYSSARGGITDNTSGTHTIQIGSGEPD